MLRHAASLFLRCAVLGDVFRRGFVRSSTAAEVQLQSAKDTQGQLQDTGPRRHERRVACFRRRVFGAGFVVFGRRSGEGGSGWSVCPPRRKNAPKLKGIGKQKRVEKEKQLYVISRSQIRRH